MCSYVMQQPFLDKYKIVSDSQYRFRSNRSTSLAIIDSIEEITKAMDQKQYVVRVVIDLKKAFYNNQS